MEKLRVLGVGRTDNIRIHPAVVERRIEPPPMRLSPGRVWIGMGLLLAVLAAVSGLVFGCATVQTPTGNEVTVSEAKGGVVARTISRVTGQDVDSVTLPTRPPTTVLLRNVSDPGLKCHEEQHRVQILKLGEAAFIREYVKELARAGYWASWLEEDARAAQAVCDQGVAP